VEIDWSFFFHKRLPVGPSHEPQSPSSNSFILFFLISCYITALSRSSNWVLPFNVSNPIFHTILISFSASKMTDCVISGFRLEADQNCALLCYYVDTCGNFLPTYRDNLLVPSCRVKNPHCLTLRRLMSYIYGAPILEVSRSHTTTQHSR